MSDDSQAPQHDNKMMETTASKLRPHLPFPSTKGMQATRGIRHASKVSAGAIKGIRGDSASMAELHLQSCVQALLALYQEELHAENLNNPRQSSYQKNWMKDQEPLMPTEIPVDVRIIGNKVEIKESDKIYEQLGEMMGKELNKQEGHYLGARKNAFNDLLMESAGEMGDYFDYLMENSFHQRFMDEVRETCEGKVIEKDNGAYVMPKEAFAEVLSCLMRDSKDALEALSREYSTPHELDKKLLRASAQLHR